MISFDYISQRGIKTRRKVEPYQLVLKNNQWYFQSYCFIRNVFRLFKVARLIDLKMETSTFTPRKYQKPSLTLSKNFEKSQIEITLRIHRSIMERLLEYCDFNRFFLENDNYYIVHFPFIENDYHYNILLSFGECCECIEPLHVRLELKRKIVRLLKLYEDPVE